MNPCVVGDHVIMRTLETGFIDFNREKVNMTGTYQQLPIYVLTGIDVKDEKIIKFKDK